MRAGRIGTSAHAAPARPVRRSRPIWAAWATRRARAAARARGHGTSAFSKLTARVLAVNVLALMLLVGGLLYLGQYEERLIQSELEFLQVEASVFAGALAEGASLGLEEGTQRLDPEQARQMVRRLHEPTDARIRLFDAGGALIADSRDLEEEIEIEPLPAPGEASWWRNGFDHAYQWTVEHLPRRKHWPAYAETAEQWAADYDATRSALQGEARRQVWSTGRAGLLLGVAVPVQPLRQVIGAVFVTRDSNAIERAVQSVREDILKVFAVALLVTVLLSLYLAGTITRPIRRLARAAEQVRRGQGRQAEIPDFTWREDEIGELSGALRDMTGALWARMDAIERFAADVAHEIKNPLTSLQSAVETVARIRDPDQQRRLLSIIQEDVQRLNRLITDISDASRLDAELSRAEPETVDLAEMLAMLRDLYATTLPEDGPRLELDIQADRPLLARGLESRLVQVVRNLIANAISFSPAGGVILLGARAVDGGTVEVTVSDEGPGIPENKLEAIFDRFYTERPAGEKFGTHSGLGLSISKQIVEAHKGSIVAANRSDRRGACFTVRIPRG